MKIKRFKLNALSAEGLQQKEMSAIVGGNDCNCSCYWANQGGSPDGANMSANYNYGYSSTQGCNKHNYSDNGVSFDPNISAS